MGSDAHNPAQADPSLRSGFRLEALAGIAQAPAWLFAAEVREGTVVRLLTAFERTVPILAVWPASRRLSTKVRIFIEHLEKTFAVCSQFNPRPAKTVEGCSSR